MPWVYNASPEVNAQSQYPKIVAVCISLVTLMAVIVGLRMYVRMNLKKSFGADDIVILFSAACSIVYTAICIVQSRLGLGLPLAMRPDENLNRYATVNFAGRPFYMVGITGFKVALCIAYLRITDRTSQKNYRMFIWVVMIFSITSHLAGMLVLLFQCSPIYKSWRPLTPGACLPNDATFYALAVMTILCDVIVFFTPIPVLARMYISSRRKAALCGVFLLGLFTTVCSVMRMIQIIQIAKDGNSTMLVLWGTIELNVGISLTCLPTLIPLFSFLHTKSSTARQYQYQYDTAEGERQSHSRSGNSMMLKSMGKRSSVMRSQTNTNGGTTEVESNSSQEAILPSPRHVSKIHGGLPKDEVTYFNVRGDTTDRRRNDVAGRITKTVEVEVIGIDSAAK